MLYVKDMSVLTQECEMVQFEEIGKIFLLKEKKDE